VKRTSCNMLVPGDWYRFWQLTQEASPSMLTVAKQFNFPIKRPFRFSRQCYQQLRNMTLTEKVRALSIAKADVVERDYSWDGPKPHMTLLIILGMDKKREFCEQDSDALLDGRDPDGKDEGGASTSEHPVALPSKKHMKIAFAEQSRPGEPEPFTLWSYIFTGYEQKQAYYRVMAERCVPLTWVSNSRSWRPGSQSHWIKDSKTAKATSNNLRKRWQSLQRETLPRIHQKATAEMRTSCSTQCVHGSAKIISPTLNMDKSSAKDLLEVYKTVHNGMNKDTIP